MERGADGRLPLAVDVGCGTGHQSTYGLKDYFTSVVGVDISQAMIQAANQENTIPNIKFVYITAMFRNSFLDYVLKTAGILYLLQPWISRKSTDRRQLRIPGDCCHSTALVWLRWVLPWTGQDTGTRGRVCCILNQHWDFCYRTSPIWGADRDIMRSRYIIYAAIMSLTYISVRVSALRFLRCFGREVTSERGMNEFSDAIHMKTCRCLMKTELGKLSSFVLSCHTTALKINFQCSFS